MASWGPTVWLLEEKKEVSLLLLLNELQDSGANSQLFKCPVTEVVKNRPFLPTSLVYVLPFCWYFLHHGYCWSFFKFQVSLQTNIVVKGEAQLTFSVESVSLRDSMSSIRLLPLWVDLEFGATLSSLSRLCPLQSCFYHTPPLRMLLAGTKQFTQGTVESFLWHQ